MNKAKQALYLIISLLVVIADQVLKSYIVSNFKIGEEKQLFRVFYHLLTYKMMGLPGISLAVK